MTQTQTPTKSLSSLADILREHDIPVERYDDSTIRFRGGDIMGHEAAKLAYQHGWPTCVVGQCYRYSLGKPSLPPFWILTTNPDFTVSD